MTWGVKPTVAKATLENLFKRWYRIAKNDVETNVGCRGRPAAANETGICDAYAGDTSCRTALPLLCIKKDGLPLPPFLINANDHYNAWAGGYIALTNAVRGTALSSVESADMLCNKTFGNGWRMAEFHDGWGWGFWAKGHISDAQRFWVRIDDQPANCWDAR